MSSDKHCCVPGCKDSGGMHRVLHGFPNPERERERFNTWLYALNSLNLLGLSNEFIFKYRRICRSHFEDKYLCRNNKISNIAVPTLNLGPLSVKNMFDMRRPLQQIQNIQAPSTSTSSGPNPIDNDLPSTSLSFTPDKLQFQNIDAHTDMITENPAATDLPVVEEVEQNLDFVHHQSPDRSGTSPKGCREQYSGGNVQIKRTRKIFLTKPEKELHKKIVSARIKLSKLKNIVKKKSAHIKAAKKLANKSLPLLENCTSTAKLLMQIQWREDKKKGKGRRFTMEEKIAALSIMKQSAKAYRFLRKIFILPAQQTLIKLVQMTNIKPGINKNIFSQLKKKAEKMKPEEKLCIILFDEMSIKANITFQERKEKICGLVDNGQQRKKEFADHVQVFMVRGLMKNYKQAVSYTFASGATKGPELATQLKTVITEVQKAGLIVVASVCDQGSNNSSCLKLLLNETRGVYLRRGEIPKDNVILINDQEIIPLYDPPHLLKGIRNNLLTKNLKYTIEGITKTAKWSHLKLLHNENPGYQGIRLIPKLTENHINPEKMNKMKVKYASQIFSRTIASNMGYLAEKGILPAECKETADLLLFMDNMFDSVNGSVNKNKHAKPLLGPATPNSMHYKTWAEGIKVFKTMEFVTCDGNRKERIPTVQNWVWTLNGIKVLLKKLKDDFQITSVWLRHLNQDPIENFFGAVRSQGCRNNNPTCDQFEAAFATLLINNLSSVHTPGKNCETDLCDALYTFIIHEKEEASSASIFDFESIINIKFTPLEIKESNPKIIAPLQYMSGYFLKKAKGNIFKACATCMTDMSSSNELEYIKYREYAGRRWLLTPSRELIKLISNVQEVIDKIMKENIDETNLKEIIKTSIIILVDFKFITCPVHHSKLVDYLIKIVIRCFVFNYCKNINLILSGRRLVDDNEDVLQIKARKLNKCFKRHRYHGRHNFSL